ncbi:hypothetical protein [Kitasatospora purpeofusca]|uniref:hypothetical protein n=1 Tax=Kitasatospora purpeofusca TaxID=67352 RepID=UPI0036D2E23F
MSASASSATTCIAANAGDNADSAARYAVINPPAIPTSMPAAVARCAKEASPGMAVFLAGAVEARPAGATGFHQGAAAGGAGRSV